MAIDTKTIAISAAVSLVVGGYITRLYYLNEINKIYSDLTAQTEKVQHESNERYKRVIELQDELKRNSASYDASIRSLSDRVQLAESRAQRATASARSSITESHARCNKLLARGAKLAERHSKLLRDTATKTDQLIELVK